MEPEIRAWPAFTVAGVQVWAEPGKSDLGAVWRKLSGRGGDGLPRRADGPEFEFYDERFDPENPGSPMVFVIPVVAR